MDFKVPSSSALRVLDEVETSAHEMCAPCPSLCRSACPVAEVEGRETTSPHRLMAQAGLLKRDKISAESVASLPYHCTTCGACEEACLHDNRVPSWVLLARHRVFKAGFAPRVAREAAACFGVAGNVFGESVEQQFKTAISEGGVRVRRSAHDVYLAGCETLHGRPEIVTTLFKALQALEHEGLHVTSLSGLCCGAPLAWTGELDGFLTYAQRFASALNDAKRVVAHDPVCAHTLRIVYPRFGVSLRPKVWTLPGYLADVLKVQAPPKPLNPLEKPRYLVLEPCHLNRAMAERGRPRALIDQLLGAGQWAPLQLDGVDDCCGAAGLLPLTAPIAAHRLAEAKIAGFRQLGAQRLVTLSPRCGIHLSRVAPELPILDLADLLTEDCS